MDISWLHREALPVSDPTALGGKAASLLQLQDHGIRVPYWIGIHAGAFEHVLTTSAAAVHKHLADLDSQDRARVEATAQTIAALFRQARLPPGLEAELYQTLAGRADFWAVRSSALSEDSAHSSFAGQLHSALYVPTEGLPDAIRAVWASGFSAGVLGYQMQRGIDPLTMRVAVIIQCMIPATAAGVLFTANPVGDISEILINAAYGIGAGVVSDGVVSDTYRCNRITGQVRTEIGRKDRLVQFDKSAGQGTAYRDLDASLQQCQVLRDEQINELVASGKRIETIFGHYQDIEWAYDDKGLWILQSRPITTIPRGSHCVFDNSNITESYPGFTKPLTFTFIRQAYEISFRQALLSVGISPQLVFSRATITRNLLGYLDGHVYYNLGNWYAMMGLVPGMGKYVRVWEKMLGIKQPGTIREGISFAEVPRLCRVVSRLTMHLIMLDRRMQRFHKQVTAVVERYRATDFDSMTGHELCTVYDNLASDLLYQWHITLINDIFCFVFTQLVQSYLKRFSANCDEQLVNDQLQGMGTLPSTQPLYSLLNLADLARNRADLKARLEAISTADDADALSLLDELLNEEKLADFNTSYQRHIERFAERNTDELKLESKTFRQRPQRLCRLILHYIEGDVTAEEFSRKEEETRRKARNSINTIFRRRPLRRAVFRFLLALARRSVMYRESSRLERARAYDLPRRIFTALGRQFCEAGVLAEGDDIFMLSVDEIIGYIQGTSVNDDLRARVKDRIARYASYAASDPLDRLYTSGAVHGNRIPQKDTVSLNTSEDGTLLGTGCCSGRVTAEAVIIKDPRLDVKPSGKIIVAPMTDPGWIFLMAQSKGLITERGSLLSHTAIVGRELGVPTIVGVPGATAKIGSGQVITMDGASGTIALNQAS